MGGGQHKSYTVYTADIGNFVWVSYYGGCAVGQYRFGEAAGNHLSAFDMDVTVDKARTEVPAGCIHSNIGIVRTVVAYTDYFFVLYKDIGFLYCIGKNIYYRSVDKQCFHSLAPSCGLCYQIF